MKQFLYAKSTVPDGIGFSLFDHTHMCWIIFFVALTIVMSVKYHNATAEGKKKIRHIWSFLLLGDELFKQTCLIVGGTWEYYYLPLQLCSFGLFLCTADAWHGSSFLKNFLYYVSLPTAMMAVLFPNWTAYPFFSFLHIHSFSVHIFIVVYILMLLFNGEIKPEMRYIPKCIIFFVCLMIPIIVVNKALGTNFFFTEGIGKTNPLQIFNVIFGNYRIGFLLLIPTVPLLMHGLFTFLTHLLRMIKK